MFKVSAPAGPDVHGPYDTVHAEPRVWFVEGVAYTDEPAFLAYFREHGYQVEQGQPPAEYRAAVETMRQTARYRMTGPVALQDAEQPGRRNY